MCGPFYPEKMGKYMKFESIKMTAQEVGEMDIKMLLDKCNPIKIYRAWK